MIVGSINEDRKIESRVAITPDNVKKFIGLGLKVLIEKNYARHLGIDDNEYVSSGAEISEDKKKILTNSNFILQFNLPSEENLSSLKENQNLIGVFNPYTNKEIISGLSKKKINVFSLELLPRSTRAQSMDILSSQANLAGYKAVVEAFAKFKKAVPMMMTAAGTIPAAKVLIVGAGVAGLQLSLIHI